MDVDSSHQRKVVLLAVLAMVVLGGMPTTITPAEDEWPSKDLRTIDVCEGCGPPIHLGEIPRGDNTTTVENATTTEHPNGGHSTDGHRMVSPDMIASKISSIAGRSPMAYSSPTNTAGTSPRSDSGTS
jgi:hypothetical protein